MSEPRLRLAGALSKANFQIDEIGRMNDNIDNHLCPFAQLPGDWMPSRHLERQHQAKDSPFAEVVDTSDEYRITYATSENDRPGPRPLLRFWEIR